jgi:alkanesulfonate monooxygenase SsuD/methylene tetrahydromethanopterin reductase-like flavin-dependent oxidoreductase (luciferase family)
LAPKPVQAHLPILIGGGGEKVTLGIVARRADECNVPGPPEVLAQKIRVLAEHCEREGRDPKSIKRTGAVLAAPGNEGGRQARGGGFVTFNAVRDLSERVGAYAGLGLDELIVHFDPRRPLPEREEFWSAFQVEVAPAFRS